MEISLWYCPNCDKLTENWRTCQKCGTPATYQRFMMWPVAHVGELPACFQTPETILPGRKANSARLKSKSIRVER